MSHVTTMEMNAIMTRSTLPQLSLSVLAIALLSVAQPLWAQVDEPENRELASSEAQLSELIANLDSANFAVRESASRDLIKIGEPAIKRLSEIPSSSSFELRHRAKLIRSSIANTAFDALSREFLLDIDHTHSHGLPGWRAFRSMVGSSRTGKLLFLEMVREQRALLELIEATDAERQLGKVNRLTLDQLQMQAVARAASIEQRLYELPSPGIGESAGLLFAAAMGEGVAPIEVNHVVSRVSQIGFYGYLRKLGYDDCLKSMLSQWIPKTHASMAPEVMTMALDLDLPAIAPTARLNLSDNFDVYTRELAFKCLAKFGSETDIPLISQYFDDVAVVNEFIEAAGGILSSNAAPPGVGQQDDAQETDGLETLPNHIVRIKDVAVLTAMLLLKEEPTTVFPNYAPGGFGINTHDLAATEADLLKQDALIKIWVETHLQRSNSG
jgi:HEAT repeat protein